MILLKIIGAIVFFVLESAVLGFALLLKLFALPYLAAQKWLAI